MLLQYVSDHFDIEEFLDNSEKKVVMERPDTFSSLPMEKPISPNFDFTIEASDIEPLTRLFVPQLEQMDTLYLEGTFNEADGFLHFDSFIPKVVYGDLALEEVELKPTLRPPVGWADCHTLLDGLENAESAHLLF